MYDFLSSFGMHGICMWSFGYDLALAWRISWIDSGFVYTCHFLDNHGVVGFPLDVSNWCSGSYGWNKHFGALEKLGLSY